MKVNWFSPLPPQPTGIADFTAQLLPFLSAAADVTVWTAGETHDRQLDRYAAIRRIDEANPMAGAAAGDALNIYQIGNNGEFHSTIWAISRQWPGIVVLHDVCLQDLFFHHFCEKLKDPEAYLRAVGKYYGKVGIDNVEASLQGHIPFDHIRKCFPLTELAVEQAAGVVSHTHKGRRALQRCERGLPVLHLPLAYAPNRPRACQLPNAAPCRQAAKPYQLIVFGHLGPNRGIAQVLEALGTFAQRDQYHLNIYGTLSIPPKDVQRYFERWKLQRCVTLHGPVPEPVLEAALSQSDLAINLRFPTMGEASHSQLRIWDHALPSIVTQAGWYAGLPPQTVAAVRPRTAVKELQQHLIGFLRDKTPYEQIGRMGNQWLHEQHDPENYVSRLLEFGAKTLAAGKTKSRQKRPRFSGWSSVALRERLQNLLAAKMDRWCPPEVKRSIHARAERVMGSLQGKEL
jgi:glycosyltransferase involved in cell wall biosynthesis